MKKLVVAFDVDDTLIPYTSKVLEFVNKKFNKNYTLKDIEWGFPCMNEEERRYVESLFMNKEFTKNLECPQEARELVEEVTSRGHDVVFISSVNGEVMSERASFLLKNFPSVHPNNRILTGRKDLCKIDLLFDDKVENIKTTIAKIPVIVDQNWNKNLKGYIRRDFLDYLPIIKMAEQGYNRHQIYEFTNKNEKHFDNKNGVVILFGGSTTGKTTIANKITELEDFEKVVTYTTRPPREKEKNNIDYYFVSETEFIRMIQSDLFLEYTEAKGNFYGTSKGSILDVFRKNKTPVCVMTIEGAKKVEEKYPSAIFYIKRAEKDIIKSIEERDCSQEEKIERLLGIKSDMDAMNYCHYMIDNNSSIEDAVDFIKNKI